MSKKNTSTVCSGIEWNSLLGLLVRLKRDLRNREYLLIGTGAYLGLRASDLLDLKWSDVLDKEELYITEKKTGKYRSISINTSLKEILTYSTKELSRQGKFHHDSFLFANRKGGKVSIQYINRILKKTFADYGVKTQNASTHTLRKTFGKRVWEMDGKSERSLIYLSQIFNHSSVSITRRYIGIVQEDIRNIYLSL
jgi:integrase